VAHNSSSSKRKKFRTPKKITWAAIETPGAASTSKVKFVKRKLQFIQETDTSNSAKNILNLPYWDSESEEDQIEKNQSIEDSLTKDLSPPPNPMDKKIIRLKDRAKVYKVLYE